MMRLFRVPLIQCMGGSIVAAGLPAGRGEARTADTISLNDVGVGYGYVASGSVLLKALC